MAQEGGLSLSMLSTDPPHPYINYSHCWLCRAKIFDTMRQAAQRLGVATRREKARLFIEIHRDLRAEAALDVAKSRDRHERGDGAAERLLWVEVLVLALEDLGHRSLAPAARRWIESLDAEPGSFYWTCCVLGIDPAAARERILRSPPAEIRRRLRFRRARSTEAQAQDYTERFTVHAV